MRVSTDSAAGTQSLAEALALICHAGDVVVLAGEMGAGKTAFTQGFARGLGVSDLVTSPTFTIVREYPGERLDLHHLDVYRLDQIREDIVDPGKEIESGFDNIMPGTYGDSIPAEDLDKLINLMEDVDLSRPGLRADVTDADTSDVVRLCKAFNRMLARVEDERSRTGSAVLEGQEQERARLARDLHDECNQALTGILLRLEALGQRAEPDLRAELSTVKDLTTQAMEELLHLARELRPTALDDHGLRVALQAQTERYATVTGLITQLHLEEGAAAALEQLTEQEQIVVYRITQEAMSNAFRHADATAVDVRISATESGAVLVTVRDNGKGIPTRPKEGLGLVGMRERARLASGSLAITRSSEGGTEVRLQLAEPATFRKAA